MGAKLDIRAYAKQRQPTIDWYHSKGRGDFEYTSCTIACYTHLPVIVAVIWLGEELGFNDQITNKIKSLVKFYGYDGIVGLSDNFPKGIFKDEEK